MRKLILFVIATLLISSCGVGVYSVSSGKADEAQLSFVAATKYTITVSVDNNTYTIETVSNKSWQKNRDIKRTALNTIDIPVGQHELVVTDNGNVVVSKKIFVSAGEHKIIEL